MLDQVIAAFYVAAWVTVILLAIYYFASAPDEFDNFGSSKLDIHVVKNWQAFIQFTFLKLFRQQIQARASPKTTKALQKAILLLSDQQLITGASIVIVGLARLCEITQYHFNTVINLSLAASIAHSMTFSFVEQYIKQNTFFRVWRAIAMLLFGALLLGTWTVTGSNDWLEVYGLPALCGYENLGQAFGAPATISLALLYWFLVRGWAYSVMVLFPNLTELNWLLFILSSSFWLNEICKILQKACKESTCQLQQKYETLQHIIELLRGSNQSTSIRIYRSINARILQAIWIFLCGISLLLFGVIYGASQVWGSFVFNLCWACYFLAGSVQIVAGYRATAMDNGMIGSENQWSFGQQLPLLMLVLPAFAMVEMFFEDSDEEESGDSETQSQKGTKSPSGSTEPQGHLFTSASFGKTTGIMDSSQEGFMLRRRTDTEWRIGMDISDASIEPSFKSQPPSILSKNSSTKSAVPTDAHLATTIQKQPPKASFISAQIEFAKSDDLKDLEKKLWATLWFKIYVFGIFVMLSFIMVYYGI